MGHHRLELVFRGDSHVHRWKATCPCGWSAVPTRRRQESETRYRTHTRSRFEYGRLDASGAVPPGVPTPADELPEELTCTTSAG